VYRDEARREEIIASFPQGELYETKMTESELSLAIVELTQAREVIIGYVNKGDMEIFQDPKNTNLYDLEKLKVGPDVAPEQLRHAMNMMAKYDIDGDVSLFDLPSVLQDVVAKYNVSWNRVHNKPNE